jgi:predicted MFS family arabinose efflux permease
VLTATGRVTVAWVMALAVFLGTLSAFEVPFRQSFVIEMVGREDLLNAIALNSSVFNLSRIIGPVIAAALIAAVGLAACFFANAASFLAVIIAFLSMRGVVSGGEGRRVDGQGTFQEGVRYAMGEKTPRSLLLLTAAFSVFGFSFLPMLPVYAQNVLGVGATGYGGLMSAVGLGASVGALTMAALGSRAKGSTLIRFGGLMFSSALALVALVSQYWIAAFLLGVAGCSMILNNVMTNSLLQTQAPDNLRGRLMGFYSLMVLGMAPFGSLQAGWIAEHLGVRTSLALGGTVCAIATVGLGLREKTSEVRGEK